MKFGIYRCPTCHSELNFDASALRCRRCDVAYPVSDGIADFAAGKYYDNFDQASALTLEHLRGLELENEGAISRIRSYYLRRLRPGSRVLDAGCGNAISVDLLRSEGHDAWGIDLSLLRRWQWRERTHRENLAVASVSRLPFVDAFFDFVISSGVIEHVGVEEEVTERYMVRPRPDRDAERRAVMGELLRVLAAGGTLYLDFPNGAFPIDFWHNKRAGQARFHSIREGFLPTFNEIKSLAIGIDPRLSVAAVSPNGRLAFRQAGRHWYGRMFGGPARLLFRAMDYFPILARSFLNPFLVIRIRKPVRGA
ncbi:MAG TPA: methyltransferase domain-containing protein [Thermoanaerobaculia bacterium]|nr:methyltransferase domain-containing protein [Thermoanaerobaculia bacterium]